MSWQANAQNAFIDTLYPQDRVQYLALLESIDVRPGQLVLRELRLRNASGAYRWYLLRARWVKGPGQRLDRCIGTLTDITKGKEAEEQLVSDAVHDPVTELPNRVLFIDRVERELAKTLALPFRVILVDIDRFKILNDALGHDQGDQLLKIAGERIKKCIEPDETVARISGSQFAILAIEAIARRNVNVLTVEISKSLAEPIKIQAQEIALNASMGITLLNEKESTAVSMMQQATTALLEARRLGGNGATIFSANLKDDRASELGLESDLRRAIGNDEIEVHYQPICYLNTMEIAGFEALARWRHPTQGLLPPLQFIDLAEKIGLINEIGQIVLTTAGRQLGIWQRVLRRDQFFFVSVNVSASHLLDKNFSKQLQDIINRETLSLGSLKIEVTESVIMRQPQKAAKLLRHLKSIGVGLSCDDFGTGFSSLSSLRDFPFDTLKIDKSFIALETYDERSAMIVTTITDLAHRLKMVVVGEGIETQDQIDNLATLGCDLGQGYLIGQAITATEVAAKLQVLQQKVIHEPPIEEEPSPVNDRPAVKNFQSLYAPIAPIQEELETDLLPSIFALPGMSGAEPKKRVRRQTPTKRAKKPTPAKKRKR